MKAVSKKLLSLLLPCIFALLQVNAQQKTTGKISLKKMLQENKVTTVNRTASPLPEDAGYQGIHLDEKPGSGFVWLNDSQFGNGTIKMRLKGKDVLQRSFIGIAFHAANDSTFDAIYFRPFNFRSTDSIRRSHSVQYVSYPGYEWDVLRKDFPGKYEHDVQPVPDPNGWFLMSVEIDYPHIKVYVDKAATPSLVIKQLSKQRNGKIGLMTGNNSGGDFADLEINARK
ncbi:hypothetical protein [Chitinophaga rhizophila]|uniref:DUF1080 domain-containing protein n=1 Tax=Chitinophaga rhizophila TaxID=2866212 RepID=A0ABS7G5Y5_9BACT|nr:hypothetical protein [Chitinophaga rhizophila]MBW8683066.1 hypothetical protein [Chitinophaga rhizophila]